MVHGLNIYEFCTVGLESTKFSVEIHHGGFFVGSGLNVRYLDEKIAWFDNLDRNNFCYETIHYMISELGYANGGLVIVFWCPPGKSVDEMIQINFESHCAKISKASVENKVLVLFWHHEKDKNRTKTVDDISYDGCPELPDVLVVPPAPAAGHKECDSDSSNNSEDEELKFDSDSEGDPAWHDSDYDVAKDDELYAQNVDESVEDEMLEKGTRIGSQHAYVPGSDDVIEDDLELPVEDDSEKRHKSDSDDEEHKKKKKKQAVYKFKPFNCAGDMENPQFKLGMVFDSVEQLRKGISNYTVKNIV